MTIGLHQAVALVAPIVGISIGSYDNRSSWIVQYADGATPEQIAAAEAVIDAFDIEASTSINSLAETMRLAALPVQEGLIDDDWRAQSVASLTAGQVAARALDVSGIMFVASTSDPTYVWVRQSGPRLSWFATPSGAALANGVGFVRWLKIADALGVPAFLDGGAGTTYLVDPTAANITQTLTNDLRMRGDGAAISFSNNGVRFAAASATGRTLTVGAAWKACQITLSSVAGLTIGQILTLQTSTQVCTTYPTYHKEATVKIVGITGNVVSLRDPLPFHFDTGETSITEWTPRRVFMNDVIFRYADNMARIDLMGINGGVINGLEITRPFSQNIQLLLMRTADVVLRDVTIIGGGYGISVGQSCINTEIDGIRASGTGLVHPVDPHTWSNGTTIRDFSFSGISTGIASHPSFNVAYYNGRSSDEGALQIRSIGAIVEDVDVVRANGLLQEGGTGTLGLLPAYQYLRAENYRKFKRYRAPQTTLLTNEGYIVAEDCIFGGCNVDGVSEIVSSITVTNCIVPYNASATFPTTKRVTRIQGKQIVDLATPTIAAFVDPVPKTISGATNANPVVVTSIGHSLVTGCPVTISGANGMTQLNGDWIVGAVTTDTFELSGANGAAFGVWTSGGTVQIRGYSLKLYENFNVGWPRLRVRSLLVDSPGLINIGAMAVYPLRVFDGIHRDSNGSRRSGSFRISAMSDNYGISERVFKWSSNASGLVIDTTPDDIGSSATLAINISGPSRNLGATSPAYWHQAFITLSAAGAINLIQLEVEVEELATLF